MELLQFGCCFSSNGTAAANLLFFKRQFQATFQQRFPRHFCMVIQLNLNDVKKLKKCLQSVKTYDNINSLLMQCQ